MAFEATDGLNYVTENGTKFGWVLNKNNSRVPANPIGEYSVDFTWQTPLAEVSVGAVGDYAFATGLNTLASGIGSIASGDKTTASGKNATASGLDGTASGDYSHVIGRNNTASGLEAFAGGLDSVASGISSFAFGEVTTALGTDSVAIGEGLIALNNNSAVFGMFNKGTNTDTIFEIGAGLSDIARDNILEVYVNASPNNLRGAIVAPMLNLDTITNSTTNKILTTKEYVDTLFVSSGSGENIVHKGTTTPLIALGTDGDIYTQYNMSIDPLVDWYTRFIKAEGAWVEMTFGDVEEAPEDGKQYARRDATWSEVSTIADAPVNGLQYVRQDASWSAIDLSTAGNLFSDGSVPMDVGYIASLDKDIATYDNIAFDVLGLDALRPKGLYTSLDTLGNRALDLSDYTSGSTYGAQGLYSFAQGNHTTAPLAYQASFGTYNLGVTGSIFEIGNGDSITASNALTVLANGDIQAPSTPIGSDDSLITKAYFVANSGSVSADIVTYDDIVYSTGFTNIQDTTDDLYSRGIQGVIERTGTTPLPAIISNAYTASRSMDVIDTYSQANPIEALTYKYMTTNRFSKITDLGVTDTLPLISTVVGGTGTLPYSTNQTAPVFFDPSVPDTAYYLHGEFGAPDLFLMRSVNGATWEKMDTFDATAFIGIVDRPYEAVDKSQPVFINGNVYLIMDNKDGTYPVLKVDLTTFTISITNGNITLLNSMSWGSGRSAIGVGDKIYTIVYQANNHDELGIYDTTNSTWTQVALTNVASNQLYLFYSSELQYYPNDANRLLLISTEYVDITPSKLFNIDIGAQTTDVIVADMTTASGRYVTSVVNGSEIFFMDRADTQMKRVPVSATYAEFYVTNNMESSISDNANNSTALGKDIVIVEEHSTAIGKYNEGNAGTLLEVGNGVDNANRANVFEVDDKGAKRATSTIAGALTARYDVTTGTLYLRNDGLEA